jgi:hypothetical protein
MAGPQFDITIGKDGQIKIKVHGVSGKECLKVTDMLREIVGKENERKLTNEYYGGGVVQYDNQVHGHTNG